MISYVLNCKLDIKAAILENNFYLKKLNFTQKINCLKLTP